MRTRIPLVHLAALEEDRQADLPAGPYADRYTQMLEEVYGLPPEPRPEPVELTHPVRRAGLPLHTVRVLAAVSVLGLAAAMVLQVWAQPSQVPGLEEALGPSLEGADQRVTIKTHRNVHLTVRVDGVVVHDRETAGNVKKTFEGRDEVSVTVPATKDVMIWYNGSLIEPQGRQVTPRTLRFVDDESVP